jgi:nucleoside-diphosphate-sugar epimerase
MISRNIAAAKGAAAVWLDETTAPLEPRNIYGLTKLTAEGLCRLHYIEHGLNCTVLRTGRFFPEEDDTDRELSGENLKANEFLHRRLTVEDAADAHVVALEKAPTGFEVFVVSAPPPFVPSDAEALRADAARVVARYFPDAPGLYQRRGWRRPPSIGRVYNPGKAERVIGFRARTDFAAVLAALRTGAPLPFLHDPEYVSPSTRLTHG